MTRSYHIAVIPGDGIGVEVMPEGLRALEDIANPVALVRSAAMMLDFLGNGEGIDRQAHDAMLIAIRHVLKEGPRTR
jgi:isocitrate/isopropylmalate dehydrogenase